MKIESGTWYRIPKYNGYEMYITNTLNPNDYYRFYPVIVDGIQYYAMVRSCKNFNKFPHGYRLPYDHAVKGNTIYYYELSDLSNKRKRLSINTIIQLIKDCDLDLRTTGEIINIGSRNRARQTCGDSQITMNMIVNHCPINTSNVKPKPEPKSFTFASLMRKNKDAITFY